MANSPRFTQPDGLVEITFRTNASRLHLRPSPALNAAILWIVGRALALYPIQLHAFVFLSNHWHALATPCDGAALAAFLRYVHSEIAKAAQRINGVKGKVWGIRSEQIPILDEDAQIARLRYLLAHGTKEHLVASPLLWPGITTARALVGDETLVGTRIDHTLRKRLSRSGRAPHVSEFTTRYPISLTPLPAYEKLTEGERIAEVRKMLAEIVLENPGPHLGIEAVLRQDPNAEPHQSKHGRPPAAHTTSPSLYARFLAYRRAFRAAYRAAATQHATQPTNVVWPFDGFLTAVQFTSSTMPKPELEPDPESNRDTLQPRSRSFEPTLESERSAFSSRSPEPNRDPLHPRPRSMKPSLKSERGAIAARSSANIDSPTHPPETRSRLPHRGAQPHARAPRG